MIDFYVIYNPRSKARECYVGQSYDYQKRFKEHVKGRSGGKAARRWMGVQSELRVRLIARLPVSVERTRSAATAVERAIYERLKVRGWILPQIKPCGTLSADFARECAPLAWESMSADDKQAKRIQARALGKSQWADKTFAERSDEIRRRWEKVPKEERSRVARERAYARWASFSPEKRSAIAKKVSHGLTTEQRSEVGRRTRMKFSPAERSAASVRAYARRTTEQRSAVRRVLQDTARKTWDRKTSQEREEWSRRMTAARWAKKEVARG